MADDQYQVQEKMFLGGEVVRVTFNKISRTMAKQFLLDFPVGALLNKSKYVDTILRRTVVNSDRYKFYDNKDLWNLYFMSIKINPHLDFERVSHHYIIDPDLGMDKTEEQIAREVEKKKLKEKKASLIEVLQKTNFGGLESRIQAKVVGQDEALREMLMPLIMTKHKGYPRKGIPSLYLMGSSGCGKTYSVEILAQELKVPLLQIQGSQFKESHTDQNLFGSPKSYVGYDPRGGILTKHIAQHPESLILFDEIDKVHPTIYDSLTSFLWDGFVTAPGGERRDFKGYIFFTSNTGDKASDKHAGKRKMGFGSDSDLSEGAVVKERTIQILKNRGVSEAFLGRINAFVKFNRLSDDHLLNILDGYVAEANQDLKNFKVQLSGPARKQIIFSSIGSELFGARDIWKNFDKVVIGEICYNFEMLGNVTPGEIVDISFNNRNGAFTYSSKGKELFRKSPVEFGLRYVSRQPEPKMKIGMVSQAKE